MNLIEALQAENTKSRAFLVELDETAVLLGHKSAAEDLGINLSRVATLAMIAQSEKAIASGDVVQMVGIAQLQGIGGD